MDGWLAPFEDNEWRRSQSIVTVIHFPFETRADGRTNGRMDGRTTAYFLIVNRVRVPQSADPAIGRTQPFRYAAAVDASSPVVGYGAALWRAGAEKLL